MAVVVLAAVAVVGVVIFVVLFPAHGFLFLLSFLVGLASL